MKKSVLIIEDNTDIQEIYKIFFEEAWFLVYKSLNGLDGIVDLVQKKPNVILLDLMMPTMDGYEVLRSIKEQTSFEVPIIVCSNLSQEQDREKAFQLWADHFLIKSNYSGEEVVTEVINFLEKYDSHSFSNH